MNEPKISDVSKTAKSPENKDNILNDYKVEEVIIGGNEYYRLDKHFIFPSGNGEKLFVKSMCPNGLEERIKELINEDIKNTGDLLEYKEKKRIEEIKKTEVDTKENEKEVEFRKKVANIFNNLSEGEEYGHKGFERIPFTAKEIGSKMDVVSLIKKQNGKVIFRCSSSGSNFGYSKSGYYSEEEIDATEFLKKELEK
jgi:hypothetical protein